MTDPNIMAKELYGHLTTIKRIVMSEHFDFTDSELGSMNLKEVNVIIKLGEEDECNMRELAEYLSAAYSTMTGIVDKLVKNDFVERFRTEDDRRVVKVKLTKKGKKLSKWVEEQSIIVYKTMLTYLDKVEQDKFLSIFRKISERMQNDIQKNS